MTTGWGAPSRAYEYMAAAADGDAAAGTAIWKELDCAGRADLVLALAAQARFAAGWSPARADAVRAAQLLDLAVLTERRACKSVREYAIAALAGRGDNRRPRCGEARCYRAAADALAGIRLATGAAYGFSRPMLAHLYRRAAATGRTS